jgi:hypothetical protein
LGGMLRFGEIVREGKVETSTEGEREREREREREEDKVDHLLRMVPRPSGTTSGNRYRSHWSRGGRYRRSAI